jgi:DNA-binding response OmpR family regulator
MTMQPSDLRRLRTLAEENEILREEVRQLREALTPTIPLPRVWRLGPMEERFLRALRRAGQSMLSRETLMQALYCGRDDAPDARILDAHACHLRRKMAAYGPQIVVETIRGEGFRLTASSIVAFDTAVAADQSAYAAALANAPFQYWRAA